MRRNKTGDLQRQEGRAHEQGCAKHAEGHQLRRHGEEVKPSLLSALVLHCRVTERDSEPLEEEHISSEEHTEGLEAELAMLPIHTGRSRQDRDSKKCEI